MPARSVFGDDQAALDVADAELSSTWTSAEAAVAVAPRQLRISFPLVGIEAALRARSAPAVKKRCSLVGESEAWQVIWMLQLEIADACGCGP